MCGFAGIINFDGAPAERNTLDRMGSSLFHRGPDDSGTHVDKSVGLAFRRLSILDLSPAGHQPMVSHNGNFVMVFNGEIYNYVELRRELEGHGCRFRSSGDTEVLLEAYAVWGKDCLPKLNGMWAFLIYDKQRGVVFGARDRFGVKPLYYYRYANGVCLASEIKAIRASGLYHDDVNWQSVSKFSVQGRLDESEETFYRGITQVAAGSAFEVSVSGEWKQWAYWSLADLPQVETKDPVLQFRDLFEDAVRLRMRSDVPLGICLSGGLDSTAIICSVARLKSALSSGGQEQLLAFSYMAPEFDERLYIADTLARTHAELRQLETSPTDLWDDLQKFLWFHDEPVHSMTAMIGYKLMQLASKNGVKVVLNGQGADETAAGYFSYFADYWRTLVMDHHPIVAWREIGRYQASHGGSRARVFLNAGKEAIQWRMRHSQLYGSLSKWKKGSDSKDNKWFQPEFVRFAPEDELDGLDGRLDSSLKRSVSKTPLPIFLRVEDRNSMAHSIEARLPFLDYRLVTLLFNLSAEWKLSGPLNKFILREAMRERIPESVRTRQDKMGFPTPIGQWFRTSLFKQMRDVLMSQEARERGIYNVPEILKDFERHQEGRIDASQRLFNVAQLEMWHRMLKKPLEVQG